MNKAYTAEDGVKNRWHVETEHCLSCYSLCLLVYYIWL